MADQDSDESLFPENYGKYKPNKEERDARRQVYKRWQAMRDDGLRKEAEQEWDSADKEYRMYIPEIDPDDWRSHLELPDSFAAIQTSMQETIERKSRPTLIGTDGDGLDAKEKFQNTVLDWNMTRTGFDLQYFHAKLTAAIRGTAFLKNYYRVETRTVKDPVDVDEEGELIYKEKKITDFDDDYTEWIDNQWLFFDPAAKGIDEASDCIEREILPFPAFLAKYKDKPGFKDVEYVRPGGDVGRTTFFKVPQDLMVDEVEILHYKNRDTDDDFVVANNVVIHTGPLQTKHKELPYAVVYHYRVPGRFWGLGIPKVVKYLSEERKAIRRLNLDRQKLTISGFWLTNNAFDLDEEETQARPGGMIGVETGGQPLTNVIQRVDMGDVPSSYFRTEEILLEDIRRAHGIDDRIQGVSQGGTATEAAILKESALKRVNMISALAEMDTIVRIGRLKWSNIQFFYKADQYQNVYNADDEDIGVEKPKDRAIVVDGGMFRVEKDPATGKNRLSYEEVDGKTIFKLDKTMARYIDGDNEVTVDATVFTPVSKAIKQAKTTEMMTTIGSNPLWAAALDPNKAVKRYVEINDESPNDWLKTNVDPEKMVQLADIENHAMAGGMVLQGTEGATAEHTREHLNYTNSPEYDALPEHVQQIFLNHIMEEHDANPLTGSSADAMAAAGLGNEQPPNPLADLAERLGTPGAPAGLPGPQNSTEGAPSPSIQPTAVPNQIQTADITPANNNPRPE